MAYESLRVPHLIQARKASEKIIRLVLLYVIKYGNEKTKIHLAVSSRGHKLNAVKFEERRKRPVLAEFFNEVNESETEINKVRLSYSNFKLILERWKEQIVFNDHAKNPNQHQSVVFLV